MDPDLAKRKRQRAHKRGYISEYLAALYLFAKGYRILSLRYKTKLGEIDIVAKRGDVIVFVEVKARTTHAQALDAVGFASQRRIRGASDLWLAQNRVSSRFSSRFDIVAMRPFGWPVHLVDAF